MNDKKLLINQAGEIIQADTGIFVRGKPRDPGVFQSVFQGTILSGDRIGTKLIVWAGNWREFRGDGKNPWKSYKQVIW